MSSWTHSAHFLSDTKVNPIMPMIKKRKTLLYIIRHFEATKINPMALHYTSNALMAMHYTRYI